MHKTAAQVAIACFQQPFFDLSHGRTSAQPRQHFSSARS